MSRFILFTLAVLLIAGIGYAASLTRISGQASFVVSFNGDREVKVAPLLSSAMMPPEASVIPLPMKKPLRISKR